MTYTLFYLLAQLKSSVKFIKSLISDFYCVTIPLLTSSCPTKLAEYLYFGVIPVLRSTKIGDFARLGMKFVRYDEFKLKRVPSKEECEIIRSVNMKVLKKLQIEFQAGRKKLRKLICIEAI